MSCSCGALDPGECPAMAAAGWGELGADDRGKGIAVFAALWRLAHEPEPELGANRGPAPKDPPPEYPELYKDCDNDACRTTRATFYCYFQPGARDGKWCTDWLGDSIERDVKKAGTALLLVVALLAAWKLA